MQTMFEIRIFFLNAIIGYVVNFNRFSNSKDIGNVAL